MPIHDVVLGVAAGVGIDLSPDGKLAYFVEWSIGELSLVEVSTGMVTRVRQGLTFPQDVEVDWDTREIYVSERTGNIVEIGAEGRPRTVASPGDAPHQLALVKDGGRRFLYTVCYGSGKLLRIDLNTHAIDTIVGGLGHPVGLVIDANHKFAFVTEQDTQALTKIEISTGVLSLVLSGLIQPFFLAWDRDQTGIFCVQRDPANSLLRIEVGPPTVATVVANGLAWRPSGVAPSADNKLIYICADRELEVISSNGGPTVEPGRPPFAVHSIQFNLDRSNAIALKDHLTGSMVPLPEFEKGSRNGPAAYLVNTLPSIKVVLRKMPGFTAGTYAIGATGSLGGIKRIDVAPIFNSAGFSDPIDFEFMWPLPAVVGKPDVTLDWYARLLPGPSVPVQIGSASHRIYLLLARPQAPWDQEQAWVGALEMACGWADGAATLDAASGLITERYNGSGRVSYDTIIGETLYGASTFMLSQMLERMNGGLGLGEKVNCTDSANTVCTLANLLGCELWASVMGYNFNMNEVIAIGFNHWEIPFGSGFSYHEVAWKGGCDESEHLFDGCLKVDGDADPTTTPHTPLLPVNIQFGSCSALGYRLRLCPDVSEGCNACKPQPSTRKRRPIA